MFRFEKLYEMAKIYRPAFGMRNIIPRLLHTALQKQCQHQACYVWSKLKATLEFFESLISRNF